MKTSDKIFNLLKKTAKFLEDNKIDYYLDGGTLLGAKRDGDIIEWDDDADIVILGSLENVRKSDGLDWIKVQGGWKLFDTSNEYPVKNWKLHCNDFKKKNPHLSRREVFKQGKHTYVKGALCEYSVPFIDVGVVDYDFDGMVKYLDNGIQYWSTAHPVHTVFPLQKIKIRDTEFACPSDTHKYLMNEYGEYWITKKYNHGFNPDYKKKDMPDQKLQYKNYKPKIIKSKTP